MSSKKHRKQLRYWHIYKIKPDVVLRYGKEIEQALIEQEIESAQDALQRAIITPWAHIKYRGSAYRLLLNWEYGYEPDIRFIIPSGKVRVRNMVMYWDRK